ncbi:hypothetical protein H6F93_27945 [Leptolyngbya sp. FACHB-671]|uniref:hypothetical protein n=1 Tax=Leptolyngbya sp. FACHB-671 TaxID=2692812 RepID=UPI0016877DF6|nr:hypothetical protein [Leptolyngbya sp. FACHB-671]MBD2071303.1 hypothetical protein [Leptolyngbya sp. FACHB-671]
MNHSPSNSKSDVRCYSSDHSAANFSQVTTKNWAENIQQFLIHLLIGKEPEVQAWQNFQHSKAHPEDILWSAYDPATGKGIYNVSEAEVRRWLEQR